MAEASILLTDLTGSTALFERVGQAAVQHVNDALTMMRTIIEAHDGQCIRTQGDDSLGLFGAADDGFNAARDMLGAEWPLGLHVHAGLYLGEVAYVENDIYGDAVNMAARLAALAKPGELLVGDAAYDELADAHRAQLLALGGLRLKGKSAPTRVHAFTTDTVSVQTVVGAGKRGGRRTRSAEFRALDQVWRIAEGEALLVGRSTVCDICLERPWISRQHGRLELRGAQLEYTDHSSAGSHVVPVDGPEFDVHRRGTLLHGEGTLYLGTRGQATPDCAVQYSTHDMAAEGKARD